MLNRCADCGFLGVRHIDSREIRESERDGDGKVVIEPFIERNWNPNTGFFEPVYEYWPVCPARNWRKFLQQRYVSPPSGSGRAWVMDAEALYVEWDNGECFTPHVYGFTPKEHREMLDRRRAIEAEALLRKAVLEREDQRDGRAQDWHKEEMEFLRQQHKESVLILGVAVIGATLVGAILGAVIDAGWIVRPW